MDLSKRAALAIVIAVAGCGPKPGVGGEESTSTEGTDGETGTEPDLPADPDLPPDSDLPPEPACASYDEANAFDELCFADPVQLDAAPVNFVDFVGGGKIYAAGPNNHRLFDPIEPVPESESLAIDGTTIGGVSAYLFDPQAPDYYTIATKNPNALVVLSMAQPNVIAASIPLADEPTAITKYWDELTLQNAIAVADVAGRVNLFEPSDLLILEQAGVRQLDEPVDRLHGAMDSEWGGFGGLVGLSLASSKIVRVQPPLLDGPAEWWPFWPLGLTVTGWSIATVNDTQGETLRLFSSEPAAMSSYLDFAFEAAWTEELDHPVHDWRIGIERWGGPTEDSVWEHYVLSISDARLATVGTGEGEGTSFANPQVWLEVPGGTVDFLPIGKARFLCASMSSGLNLLAPLP